MYTKSDAEVATCIEDLTKEIWTTVKLVLKSSATKEQIYEAASRAKFLRLYIDVYQYQGFNTLTVTELWLAREVAEAVEDLID